jgi:hypothetical protein
MSKPKAPKRDLPQIVAEIWTTQRNDAESVIKRGELLIEAKTQVRHGQWLLWLDQNFDLDVRTAQRTMAVAKWAAKYDSTVVFNLDVEVLYDLSSPHLAEEVAAVLEAAKHGRVGTNKFHEILADLEARMIEQTDAEIDAESQREEDDQAEAEKLLDEPPPELPAAEPEKPDPDRYLRELLTGTVAKLKQLATKKRSRFTGALVTTHDLDLIVEFLTNLKPILSSAPSGASSVSLPNGQALDVGKLGKDAQAQLAAIGNDVNTEQSTAQRMAVNADLAEVEPGLQTNNNKQTVAA